MGEVGPWRAGTDSDGHAFLWRTDETHTIPRYLCGWEDDDYMDDDPIPWQREVVEAVARVLNQRTPEGGEHG